MTVHNMKPQNDLAHPIVSDSSGSVIGLNVLRYQQAFPYTVLSLGFANQNSFTSVLIQRCAQANCPSFLLSITHKPIFLIAKTKRERSGDRRETTRWKKIKQSDIYWWERGTQYFLSHFQSLCIAVVYL